MIIEVVVAIILYVTIAIAGFVLGLVSAFTIMREELEKLKEDARNPCVTLDIS